MMGLPASVIAATVLFAASPAFAITEQMAAGAVNGQLVADIHQHCNNTST
jgi:hypothetical protein